MFSQRAALQVAWYHNNQLFVNFYTCVCFDKMKSEIDTEQFKEEIGKYDCLFNRFSKEFKDKFKKINAWSKEGEVFSISLAGAKKKFRNLRTTYERYLTRRNIVFRLLTAPVQFSPSPIYPGLHVQTYVPCVLVHAAFAWHSIEVVLHSSKSVKNK